MVGGGWTRVIFVSNLTFELSCGGDNIKDMYQVLLGLYFYELLKVEFNKGIIWGLTNLIGFCLLQKMHYVCWLFTLKMAIREERSSLQVISARHVYWSKA